MTTRQRILLSVGATAALALGLVRCVGSERGAVPVTDGSSTPNTAEPAPAVGAADTSGSADPVAPSGTFAAADQNRALVAVDGGVATSSTPLVDAGPRSNPTAALLQQTDAPDRDLLADVERLTKKSPPPAVNELIALQHRGATRAELAQFIDKSLSADIALRTSCLRWLEQVQPSGRVNGNGAPGLSTTADPHIKQPARRRSGP